MSMEGSGDDDHFESLDLLPTKHHPFKGTENTTNVVEGSNRFIHVEKFFSKDLRKMESVIKTSTVITPTLLYNDFSTENSGTLELLSTPNSPTIYYHNEKYNNITNKFLAEKISHSLFVRRRNLSSPFMHVHTSRTLCSDELFIPLLLLSTVNARSLIESKNDITLSQLFNVMANSISSSSSQPLWFPPIRSVNKCINLKNCNVSFIDVNYLLEPIWRNNMKLGEATYQEDALQHALEPVDVELEEINVNELERRILKRMSSLSNVHHSSNSFGLSSGDTDEKNPLTSSSPWLNRFRFTLDDLTDDLPHDMTLCPVACVIVASTSEASEHTLDPIECLAELAHCLPLPYRNGTYDPDSLVWKDYVLLHDIVDGPSDFDEKLALDKMQSRFGPGCAAVLPINELTSDRIAKEEDHIWKELLPIDFEENDSCQIVRGRCFSSREKLAMRRYMAHKLTQTWLPAIERRITTLNTVVSQSKKGVKNAIKSLWRKPRDSFPMIGEYGTSNAIGTYPYHSIESRTRLLADTLVLVRDYESALDMYRLVVSDYKQDHRFIHLASAHEMMALCHIMVMKKSSSSRYCDGELSRQRRELLQHVESAFYWYSRTAALLTIPTSSSSSIKKQKSTATRCATRLCLVLSSIYPNETHLHVDLARILANASLNETPLCAAVLLELASIHYRRGGLERKYAMYILMAGDMYRSTNIKALESHSLRCFVYAFEAYDNKGWEELCLPVVSAIASQMYNVGKVDISRRLYIWLLNKSSKQGYGINSSSVKCQREYIVNLLKIAKNGVLHKRDLFFLEGLEKYKNDMKIKLDQQASYVLEMYPIDLPLVIDASLMVVDGDSEGNMDQNEEFSVHADISEVRSSLSLGTSGKGKESIWIDMIHSAHTEWLTFQSLSSSSSSDSLGNTTRRLLKNLQKERSTVFSSYSLREPCKFTHRTRMEPLTVIFTLCNLFNIDISISDMQLVAQITCDRTSCSFGTHHDFHIPLSSCKDTIQYSDKVFESPDFARYSDNNMSWNSTCPCLGQTPIKDSFFFVSKVNTSLRAGDKKIITLSIYPIVSGTLELLGIRWKIFSEIWIYHHFDLVKIPSLIKRNIACNSIARNNRCLQFQIDRDMPKLTVDMIPSEDNCIKSTVLLQGQVSEWILRVSNVGTAPTKSIHLKTNMPWINIRLSSLGFMDGENQYRYTSWCSGLSGTFLEIPLSSLGHGHNILLPGDSLDVRVEIRISLCGKQDLYMLFRYELWEENSSNYCISHETNIRWLRKMTSVFVYPSLSLTASLSLSHFGRRREHLLSIEIMNSRSDNSTNLDINLDKICIVSRYYRIIQLRRQTDNNRLDIVTCGCPLAQNISPQEQITFHYIVRPLDENDGTFFVSDCPVIVNNEFYDWGRFLRIGKPHFNITDFMCLEHAHQYFKTFVKYRQHKLALLESEEKKIGIHPRSIAQIRKARKRITQKNEDYDVDDHDNIVLAKDGIHFHSKSVSFMSSNSIESSKISIICLWNATTLDSGRINISGKHHLKKMIIGSRVTSKLCPLVITARYPLSAYHDFSEYPLYLDLEITVCNRFSLLSVQFEFNLNPKSGLEFVGSKCLRWILMCGEELIIPLQAVVFTTGVHNLQSVMLTIYDDDNMNIPFFFPMQWIVKVSSLNKRNLFTETKKTDSVSHQYLNE